MNKFWLLLSVFSVSTLQAQTANDTLEILELLEKESRTWRSGDIAEHASCWQERSYNKVWINRGGGELLDIPAEVIIHPSEEMTGQGGQAFLSNFQFNIYGNQAWVNHDEVSVEVDGKETYTHEMRLLEKVNGDWKLVGQSLYPYQLAEQKTDTTSYLNIVDITSKKVETVLIENRHFEAPNWHKDGYLLFNSYGFLEKLDLKTMEVSVLPTGNLSALNNDHGLSPDQSTLVLSNFDKRGSSWDTMESALYVMPVEGGEPKKVSSDPICFWHGWSMDGKTLAYTGIKKDNLDIYTIPVEGGKAKRLTKTEGLDDGPEYSPDGKYIYFNSYRSRQMQIWRMGIDGSNPEQLTFDSYSNWFPHISPDNQWMVYISYTEDQKQQHLFGKKVKLRLMNLQTREITDLTSVFYGGQGTINVPSWSPDSRRVAFVSYSIGN
jgi:WD40 repeat protein